MFKKVLMFILVLGMFSPVVYSQDSQYSSDIPIVDVIGDITKAPEVSVVPEVKPEVDVEKAFSDLSKETQDNIKDMKKIAADLLELAKELKNILPVKTEVPVKQDTEVIGDNTEELNLTVRVQNLESSVKKLEAGELTPALDSKIRKLAVEEYEKIQVTVKSKTGEKVNKEVILSSKAPQTVGYSGGFVLNPGETLVSVDGVPVQTQAYNDNTVVGATNNTIVAARGLPNNGFMLNIVRPPVKLFRQSLSSSCRMVNGVKVCN